MTRVVKLGKTSAKASEISKASARGVCRLCRRGLILLPDGRLAHVDPLCPTYDAAALSAGSNAAAAAALFIPAPTVLS